MSEIFVHKKGSNTPIFHNINTGTGSIFSNINSHNSGIQMNIGSSGFIANFDNSSNFGVQSIIGGGGCVVNFDNSSNLGVQTVINRAESTQANKHFVTIVDTKPVPSEVHTNGTTTTIIL